MLRTRPAYASAIRAAADVDDQDLDLRDYDVAVLAVTADHQPITRDGLKDIFGKEISRDLIDRLHARGLIGTGPRSSRRGAPYTYVTTEKFLVAFDLESLQDLPDREQLKDDGVLAGNRTLAELQAKSGFRCSTYVWRSAGRFNNMKEREKAAPKPPYYSNEHSIQNW